MFEKASIQTFFLIILQVIFSCRNASLIVGKVRSCALYDDEYSDCTSIRSRTHQYFVKGKLDDCGPWKRDYNNCINWDNINDRRAFKELVEAELQRRNERLAGHIANDVWEKRPEPPTNWNDPLPPHIAKRMENSYLALRSKEIKEGDVKKETSTCVIS